MAAASRSGVGQVNASNPAVKRIMREYAEFSASYASAVSSNTPIDVVAAPLEDNLFEWHFTLSGPPSTAFATGLYHGRILLPSNYPFRPPDVVLLTPSGRFETGKKICLSISSFHPANWQPSWSIRTVLTALTAFFPTPAAGAIGSLDYTETEKAALAVKSRHFTCPHCKQSNEQIMEAAKQRQLQQQSAPASTSSSPAASGSSSPTSSSSSSAALPAAAAPAAAPAASPAAPLTSSAPPAIPPRPAATQAVGQPPSALPAAPAPTATPASTGLPTAPSASSSLASASSPSASSPPAAAAGGVAQPAAAASSSSSPAAASAAAVAMAAAPSKLSRVTVLLTLLIFALLFRKLIGHLLRLHSSSSGLQHSTSSMY